MTDEDVQFVNKLFNAISTVKIIEEEDFELGADLTKCSAFIAQIFHDLPLMEQNRAILLTRSPRHGYKNSLWNCKAS